MNNHGHQLLLPVNIPLHCNICPKKPDFSDVSHLLTHIASKGHLSHYYKMKVKASTDALSQQIVTEYDEWYEEWNVQDLMRERMSQKERKKGGSNGGANGSRRASVANSTGSKSGRNTPLAVPLPARRPYALRENTLDPQLDRTIKEEPKSRSTTPAIPFAMDPAAMSRRYAPPMQVWSATPYADSPMTQDRSAFDSLYNTPSTDSMEHEQPMRTSARSNGRNMSGSNQSLVPDAELEFDDGQSENTKLKGVVWDGMGLFDSATPDMRRKRNQKKAGSVMEYLKATSEVIEATEYVYDADGVLRRERPITGNPEEEDGLSPLKGESDPEPENPPPKKKATRKPRAALTEKDANSGRATRRRGESHHPPFGNNNRRTPYFDGGADEDDELTYGRPRPRQRTGLSIHRDNSGPDITFDNPPPMSTLTSGFRNPFHMTTTLQHRSQSAVQNGYTNRNHPRPPSLQSGRGFRPSTQNPLAGFQPSNFGTFGQLSGSLFSNANFHGNHNSMPVTSGQQAFSAFQNHFGLGPNHFGGEVNGFQAPSNNASQIPHAWDVFGFGQQDVNVPAAADGGFPVSGDLTTVNPLFFSSNHIAPEDDEATVSPPSERGER